MFNKQIHINALLKYSNKSDWNQSEIMIVYNLQVHREINYSIKKCRTHRDQCQPTVIYFRFVNLRLTKKCFV